MKSERRGGSSPRPSAQTNTDLPAKPTPSVVNYVIVGVILVAALLAAFYAGAPVLLPGLLSADLEQGLAELASCRLQVSALNTALKARDRELILANDGNGMGGPAVLPGMGMMKGPKGLREKDPEDMDDESKNGEIRHLRELVRSLRIEKRQCEAQASGDPDVAPKGAAAQKITEEAVDSAKKLLKKCNIIKPPMVGSSVQSLTSWKGYECNATREDMARYLDYKPGELCPNDWYFVQRLIFKKNCFSLPRRRCLSITPARPKEPLPLPDSLFSQRALRDENVRWDLMQCKSYECLNTRRLGDCLNCFNMDMERHRWKNMYRGGLPIEDVLAMKPGSIRLGLDVGGGTGSFAAHMALQGVTVMTTAFNVETVTGHKAGLPYMETIAQRGLIPLHWPHKARLPLYDGVLDIIHSVNSIKYIPPVEFQELAYEWDRVLRAGGLLWFEMFYAPVSEMPTYVAIVEGLAYKKLYWNFTPKPDSGEKGGEHVYLNCVLEKPARPGNEALTGPREQDMEDIV